MTVNDLINHLQTLPKDLPVAYRLFSEQCLLEIDDIKVVELCEPRSDGWIQNKRPDMPSRKYLLFSGS